MTRPRASKCPLAARAAMVLRVGLPGLALTSCQTAVLDPKGVVGIAERTILLDSMVIMLAIVVPTIACTLAFAWWFRRTNTRSRYRPDWTQSGRIELVTWSIPALTVALLAGVTWIGSHQLDPNVKLRSAAPPLEVQVVSLDWKWLFIYPDRHVASVNQLEIPVGVPVHFSLTSSSVMNAFFVPRLGSMIYTMNGMVSQLNLRAEEAGRFEGMSAHFSGDGFPGMHFAVNAVPPDAFANWIDGARQSADTLDGRSYAALARQSSDVAPITYRDDDRELFTRIVSLQIPPGPGPPDRASPAQPALRKDQ